MLKEMSKRFSIYLWVTVLLSLIGFDVGSSFELSEVATAAIIGAAAASVVGGLVSDYINTKNQADTNDANKQIARENRAWQSQENELSRAWSQHMFDITNAYNTPSAQNARLREAGYNPFLASGQSGITPGLATATNANTSSQAPQAPSMQAARVGAASQALGNLPSQLINYYSTDAQVKAADANAANATSQAEKNIIENAQQIYKMYGKDASEKYFANQMKSVQGSYDGNLFATQVQAQVDNEVYTAKMQKIITDLKGKYGEKEILNNLNVQDQAISESVARIGKMASDTKLNESQIKLNQAKIREVAASCIEKVAHAWNLRKQGEYFVAETTTANAIRQSIIDQMQYKTNMMRRADVSDYSNFVGNKGIRNWLESEEGQETNLKNFQILQDEMLNELDRYIKVLSPFVDKMPEVNFNSKYNYFNY